MAKSQPGTVTKIYQLKTIGRSDVVKDLDILKKKFEDVKKAKTELSKQKSSVNDDAEIKKVNEQIKEQIKRERELTLEIKKRIAERKQQKLVEEAARRQQFSNGLAENSIAKARADNKTLRAERDLLNEGVAEEKARIDELNLAIDKNNELIKRNSSVLEQQKINIGNYEGSAKLVVDALKKVEDRIEGLKEKQQQLQNLSKRDPIGFKVGGGQESLNQVNAQLGFAVKQSEALHRVVDQPQFLNVASKFGDATAELKFFTKALIDLERQGQGNTEMANELRSSLAKLQDEIKDTKEEVRALSSDTRGFDLFAGSVNFAADAFQTIAGAAALAGASEKDVQEQLKNLVAIQSIANGVKGIANELTTRGTAANKAYAFVQAQVATLTNASATATARWGAVFKLTVFGLVATAIGFIIAQFTKMKSTSEELVDSQKSMNNIAKETAESFSKEKVQLDAVISEYTRKNTTLKRRKEIIEELQQQYPAYFKNLSAEKSSVDEITKAYEKVSRALILRARISATTSELAKNEAKVIEFAAKNGIDDLDKLEEFALGFLKNASDKGLNPVIKGQIQQFLTFRKTAQGIIARTQQELDALGGDPSKGENDKKTDAVKDQLSRIDAIRDAALAEENKRILEIRKVRELALEEEIDHARKIESINLKAVDDKKEFLKKQKKLDADQVKQIAELGLARVNTELATEKDIQELKDKFFEEQSKKLKDQLDREINAARESAERVEEDPNSTQQQRVQAKLDADNEILDLQRRFNEEMKILEKELNQSSKENAEERKQAIKDAIKNVNDDAKELALALIVDMETNAEKILSKMRVEFSKQRELIINNEKLNAKQKQKAIEQLSKAQKVTLLSAELALLNKETLEKKKLYEQGLLSNEEYIAAVEAQQSKAEEVANAMFEGKDKKPSSIKGVFAKLFGFPEDGELGQLLGDVLSQAYSLAQSAMSNFYDAERDRINENLNLQLERLELEKEQVIARAQSQAEIESLEKQYAAKKRKAEQEAGERLKKTKRAEAKIALATELANIAVAAAQNPANGVTFGAAGAIMYGILAALAFGRYALNVSAINREKFEYGGAPTKRGGQARGKSHAQGGIPFNYEAENKELFIINKNSAEDKTVRTLTGTNKQIASLINQLGGGVAFAKGARSGILAKGGLIGNSLQAPVFVPSSVTTNSSGNAILVSMREQAIALQEQARSIQAVSDRIDRLQVEQVTDTVTNAQKKRVKQSAIGTM